MVKYRAALSFKVFHEYYLCIKVVIMKVIKQNGNAYHTVFFVCFLFSSKDMFLLILERTGEGRERNINQLPPEHPWACALSGIRTSNLLVDGTIPNQ